MKWKRHERSKGILVNIAIAEGFAIVESLGTPNQITITKDRNKTHMMVKTSFFECSGSQNLLLAARVFAHGHVKWLLIFDYPKAGVKILGLGFRVYGLWRP